MNKRQNNKSPVICGDCVHYAACSAWNFGSLRNTNAGSCANYSETPVKIAHLAEVRADFGEAEGRPSHLREYFCEHCAELIRTESWTDERCFGAGTILKNNEMPNFCHNCGAEIRFEVNIV